MFPAQRDPHPRWSPSARGQVVCQFVVEDVVERAEEVKFLGAGYGTDLDVVLRMGHGTLLLRRYDRPASEARVTPGGGKRSEQRTHGLTPPLDALALPSRHDRRTQLLPGRSVPASAGNTRLCSAQTALPTCRNLRQIGG